MNPRGWIMDYLHACYTSVGRWGPGASDTFTMRWYHCAPGAKEYPFVHAFGTTVDDGCQNDDPTLVGEIPPPYRTWSPSLPWLYDGSEKPVYSPALEFGANEAVMNAPCFDGQMGFKGSVTYGVTAHVTASVCACGTAEAITTP